MVGTVPHIVQYQGSKRLLANQILNYMPYKFKRYIEPFCGTAAVAIAVASKKKVDNFWLNDINEPLVNMLQNAIESPQTLYESYKNVWEEQIKGDSVEHFFAVRKQFNSGDKSPANMLYLLARCVKGAVRYNEKGELNQSCDKRRMGTRPSNVLKNILAVSSLLKGKTKYTAVDYKQIFLQTSSDDIVYMDPPYQGTSQLRDNRYLTGVHYDEFVENIKILNAKKVNFLISYDGVCGNKSYGKDLPKDLRCHKLLLNAGRSTQSTLLGRKDITYEALYVSDGLRYLIDKIPKQELLWENMG